jgi:hypothetical protein
MSRIVAVHGAFNELWGPNEIHAKWLPAISDGLWRAGEHIDAADLRICFYGDLFRHDPEIESTDAVARSRAGAQDLIASIGAEQSVESVARFAANADADRTLDLIAMLNGRPDIDQAIEDRLIATVRPDTRAVVAHSLGSIVTYLALLKHPEWRIDTFITIGSPLGGPSADSMLPPAVDGVRPFPESVSRWVNVVAVDDEVATAVQGHFGGPDAPIEERRIDNGHRGHDPVTYLNSRATGEAIARALQA